MTPLKFTAGLIEASYTPLTHFLGELSMSNTMRWRYGDTCPVMLPVDSATVIEIGDMLFLDTDDCFTISLQALRCKPRAAATRSRSAWRQPASSNSIV